MDRQNETVSGGQEEMAPLPSGLLAVPPVEMPGGGAEPSPALTKHRPALHALTGIRFFAAAYVVLFHTRMAEVAGDHGLWAVRNFFAAGHLAVPLFFLLSGFILAYTYRGQIERRPQVWRFWEARIARLWPVYFLSLVLSSIPHLTVPRPGPALATILMVQAWNPFDVNESGTWNFVCWTLSAEAFFYVCFPWFQRRLERYGQKMQLWVLCAMLAVCVGANSSVHSLGIGFNGFDRYIPFPVWHLGEFFAGVAIGNFFLLWRQASAEKRVVAGLIGSGALTYLSAIASILLLCRPEGRWTSTVVVTFSALLFGLAAEETWLARFLSTPAMLLAGGISYSMYLFQLPVKGWIAQSTDYFHYQSVFGRMALTGVALAGLSYFMFRFVEEPARRVLRAGFARLNPR